MINLVINLRALLLFSSSASNNSDDVALCDTDDVQKRNVGWTAVKAASALDTILDRVLFKLIHHIVAGIFLEKEWLETHRAGLRTLSTTDAGRLDSAHCLLGSEIK